MRAGEIYHLENVPGLHGGPLKGRYVVVVTDESQVVLDEPIYVIGCTGSQYDEAEAVLLPFSPTGQASTGLRKRTHAVPAWMLKVRPSDLGRKIGFISTDTLREIVAKLPPDSFDDLT